MSQIINTDSCPIIGLVGGAGPDACIDIQKKLFNLMKKKCNAIKDQDHYRVIVDNNTTIINRDIDRDDKNEIMFYQLMESIRWFESCGVNIASITCNSAHVCFNKLRKETDIKLISIIETTVNNLYKKGIREVFLLSTPSSYKNSLYLKAFSRYGVKANILSIDHQLNLAKVIYSIKAGCFYKTTYEELRRIYSYVNDLIEKKHTCEENIFLPPGELIDVIINEIRQLNIENVVLACTELPMLENYYAKFSGINFHDPNYFLAEKLIDTANKYVKNVRKEECAVLQG